MKTWSDCNLRAAAVVAEQDGDPAILAIAASGRCLQEEMAFESALYTIYRPARVSEMMHEFKAKQLVANTSKIIKVRVESRFPDQFPMPAAPPPTGGESEEPKLISRSPQASLLRIGSSG